MASTAEKLAEEDTEIEPKFPRMIGKLKAEVLIRLINPLEPGKPIETKAVIDLPIPDHIAKKVAGKFDNVYPTDAHAVRLILLESGEHEKLVNDNSYVANSSVFAITKVLAILVDYDGGRIDRVP